MHCHECKLEFALGNIAYREEKPCCPICLAPIACYTVTEPPAGQMEQQEHAGFIVRCRLCGSYDVGIDSDVGFSQVSGCWGAVRFKCPVCRATIEIWQP